MFINEISNFNSPQLHQKVDFFVVKWVNKNISLNGVYLLNVVQTPLQLKLQVRLNSINDNCLFAVSGIHEHGFYLALLWIGVFKEIQVVFAL